MSNYGGPKGDPQAFAVGDRVRYRPGVGSYGFEDNLEDDGRVPAVVRGHTRTRVRIQLAATKGTARERVTAVDAASLERA